MSGSKSALLELIVHQSRQPSAYTACSAHEPAIVLARVVVWLQAVQPDAGVSSAEAVLVKVYLVSDCKSMPPFARQAYTCKCRAGRVIGPIYPTTGQHSWSSALVTFNTLACTLRDAASWMLMSASGLPTSDPVFLASTRLVEGRLSKRCKVQRQTSEFKMLHCWQAGSNPSHRWHAAYFGM